MVITSLLQGEDEGSIPSGGTRKEIIMIINNMINQKSKSVEQKIVDKLWEKGYDEQ